MAMKTTVLYLTVLGYVLASPNGYYHQEYNYKTSSSSYKNNELQHQTDDQGYYRKDGDLEGRVRPKVDANSEHSEYINPNLRNADYHTGLIGGANGDLSSYGHMQANMGSYRSHDQTAEGLAHSDHISGGYSSGSYGASSYGSGSQSYSVASNLRTVTSRIQQELESELRRAIQENRAYSRNNQLDVAELERELRQNLTNRLNNELVNRYGQQSVRGGLSYTISGGRLHSTANYDNQELLDLRRQMENTLLTQLRSQYNQIYSGNQYGYSTTVRPVYYINYPTTSYRPFTTIRPQHPDYSHSNYERYTPIANPESITTIAARVQNQLDTRLNQILEDVQRKYFSSSSSYSVTNIEALLERLRNELRTNVTAFLEEDIRRNYGTQIQRDDQMYTVGPNSQTSSQYNYSVKDLESLRSQIERNLMEKLNRDFERYRSSWYQQHSQSNHNIYTDYSTTPRYTVYNTPYNVYNQPRYETYTTPRYVYSTPQYNTYDVEHLSTRPSSNHLTSLITGSGGSSSQAKHYIIAGSGQSGYEIGGSSGGSITQLQRQLQQDLSQQLQAAINRGHSGYYSSSGSYNPQSYQASLQQLSDELNRNLTRQLQEYSSSSYYSTYGNFDQAQLANLRSQLQADLMRQLQQGLQQSYHTSSSYSASSSSSSSNANYRPVRGFQNYNLGQYRAGGNVALVQGEDCTGDDLNVYSHQRMKRSYQPIGYSGYGTNRDIPFRSPVQQQEELGQQVDESDLTQQVEDTGYGKLQLGTQGQQQIELGQQVDDSDLTQQTEDVGFGKLQLGSQNQQQVGQIQDPDLTQQIENEDLQLNSQEQQSQQHQIYNTDLTQQVEGTGFGKLQFGSQQSQQQIGQQTDDSDLTQQVENEDLQLNSQEQHQTQQGYRPLQFGSHQSQQHQIGNADLTQQVESTGFGKLQFGSQQSQQQIGQQTDDSDLTQQVENKDLQLNSQEQHQTQQGYRPLQFGSHQSQQHQIGNPDLTQQVESTGFGKLQFGSQQSQQQIGQQTDDSDLTQQVENEDLQLNSQEQHQTQQGYRPLQFGSHQSQQHQIGNADLTQQVEGTGFGKLQFGSHQSQQQTDDSDLTQQVENEDLQLNSQEHRQTQQEYGQLQLGSQQSQQHQIDNADLTQQVEGTGFGKLQFGSQQSQQQIGQQTDDSELTQKVENENFRLAPQQQQQSVGSGFGKLQLGSQQGQQQIGYGPQEDNSDLTQQVENSGFSQIQLGSQQSPLSELRGDQDLTQQQTEDNGSSGLQSSSQSQQPRGQQLLIQQQYPQVKVTEQIEDNLSKRLKNAIQQRTYTITYSGSGNLQSLYQSLINDLRTNITKELQRIGSGANSYTYYSYNFNNQQLNNLQKKLENDLKLQLQQELTSYVSSNKLEQTNQANNLELTQQTENHENLEQINSGLPQQVENLDDITQQIDVDATSPLKPNQVQFTQQFKADLSNQLKGALNTIYDSSSYSGSSKPQPQVLYRQLVNELQRNITKQLQSITNGQNSDTYSYSTYYNFNKQQLDKITAQIEYDLKLQLQKYLYDKQNNFDQHIGNTNKYFDNERQQLGQEQVGTDLTQTIDNDLENQYGDLTQQSQNHGKLQFGNQQILQQPIRQKNVPGQQIVQEPIEPEPITPIRQIDEPDVPQKLEFDGQQHQETDNSQGTQEQIDLNQQVDNIYHTPQIPSANLQLHTRPTDNKFIQTEIDQQQNLLPPNSEVSNGHSSNLPTLNQVIGQHEVNEEYNTELPSKVEPLSMPGDNIYLSQQTIVDQQLGTDGENRDQTLTSDQKSNTQISPDINLGQTQTPQLSGGHSFGLTSQGQFITQQQPLPAAENNADLLIQKLREYQQNRPNPSTPGQSFTYIHHNRPITQEENNEGYREPQTHFYGSHIHSFQSTPLQNVDSVNRAEVILREPLNQQQVLYIEQLRDKLSKDIQNAVSEYHYTVSSGFSNSQLHQNYQQTLEDLRKNLNKKLQELLDTPKSSSGLSYSVYRTITEEQKEKLKEFLQADLLKKLDNNLQVSYNLHLANNQNNRDNLHATGSSGYGYNQNYNHRIHYAHQGENVQDYETASDLKPLKPQQANIVQNVDSQVGAYNNVGIKGHRFRPPVLVQPPPPTQPDGVQPSLPHPADDSQSLTPLQSVEVPPQPETTPATENHSTNLTEENLPWWKRTAHKIRQGAENLKEKIIG